MFWKRRDCGNDEDDPRDGTGMRQLGQSQIQSIDDRRETSIDRDVCLNSQGSGLKHSIVSLYFLRDERLASQARPFANAVSRTRTRTRRLINGA
jgi:hypothetical protein